MIEIGELRDAVRKAFPSGQLLPDRNHSWQLVAEMGWLLSNLPEADGGLSLGPDALVAICREQGRVLSTAPFIPAAIALEAVGVSETADRTAWIERICAGTYVPINLLSGNLAFAASGLLKGKIAGVLEADMANHVVAGTADFYGLIALDAAGVTVTERPTWDRSRRLFDVAFDNVAIDPSAVLATGAEAARLHCKLTGLGQLLIAADALGGAEAALDATIDYLKIRRQFDRPLAMFQAIKHRCADMKCILTSAEALLWALARDPQVAAARFGSLKAHATEVFGRITEEMIQLHGGIGLTSEHPSHLFMKRAMLNKQLCGPNNELRERAGAAAVEAFLTA